MKIRRVVDERTQKKTTWTLINKLTTSNRSRKISGSNSCILPSDWSELQDSQVPRFPICGTWLLLSLDCCVGKPSKSYQVLSKIHDSGRFSRLMFVVYIFFIDENKIALFCNPEFFKWTGHRPSYYRISEVSVKSSRNLIAQILNYSAIGYVYVAPMCDVEGPSA